MLFQVAQNIDEKTMILQILDTLKAIGASPSTKYIFPMEFVELVKPSSKFVKAETKSD